MEMNVIIFYILSTLAVYGAINTVIRKNLVTCALHLVVSMISLSGLFFHLGAHFIAGVQLVVYAGAVMVLFVMVIMLFDDSIEKESTSKLDLKARLVGLKALLCVSIFGLLTGIIPHSVGDLNKLIAPDIVQTKSIAHVLFTQYIFVFEWLGLLLLIIAVGVVVLTRMDSTEPSNPSGDQSS